MLLQILTVEEVADYLKLLGFGVEHEQVRILPEEPR